MTDSSALPEITKHRELVSAVISMLIEVPGRPSAPLAKFGYRLLAIEVPMADRNQLQYQADLHLIQSELNLSVLVECKSGGQYIDSTQIEKYFDTLPRDVILSRSLSTSDPRQHRLDLFFITTPASSQGMRDTIATISNRNELGWGLFQFSNSRLEILHDEISDSELSSSLSQSWAVPLDRLALELLPYEVTCTNEELADAVFQSLIHFFVSGKREFGLEDIAKRSNSFWKYLEPQHELLGKRIRNQMKSIRGTALRRVISRVPTESIHEDRWKFNRRSTNRSQVLQSLQRRHRKYLEILRDKKEPKPADFEGIDPEQLRLPFPTSDLAATEPEGDLG